MKGIGSRLASLLGMACVAAGPAVAVAETAVREYVSVPVDLSRAVDQNRVPPESCVPAAIVNALALGNPAMRAAYDGLRGDSPGGKLKEFIAAHGRRASEDYGGDRPRWDPEEGRAALPDGRDMFGDALESAGAGTAAGDYLDRKPDESPGDLLVRVHRVLADSLARGAPVVVSLRSFSPYWDEEKAQILWGGVENHCVTVTAVPESLRPHEKGFDFAYVDPDGPKTAGGYIYLEEVRPFAAARGNDVKYEWLGGPCPFLLVRAPGLSLGMGEKSWYWRTIVTLNYAMWFVERP